MIEVGRAQKTTFVAATCVSGSATRDQRGPDRRRVVEPGQSVIFLGKGGDIATNRRDEQELSVLCLPVLQAALIYVTTLMIHDVLANEDRGSGSNSHRRRRVTTVVNDGTRRRRSQGHQRSVAWVPFQIAVESGVGYLRFPATSWRPRMDETHRVSLQVLVWR